jgi:hypothetical protein
MFFNEYPYRNLTDLNLDYLLRQIKYLTQQITDFVNINSIKYANPIQWNITKQYEKNTVVIDGNTGTAYLSVQPVPNGIALANTDYWTVIFTLDILNANHNITAHDAGANPTATFPSDIGDWLLWNSILYKVTRPIVLHEAYHVGYNLTEATVDDFVHEYVTALANKIGELADLNTTDKTNLVSAINEVLSTIGTVAGDLTDLNTTDKSNLVNAINEVLSTIGTVSGDLTDLDTTDKTNLVSAINEVLSTIGTVAGDLTDLDTTNKDNLVNAINEVLSTIGTVSGKLTNLNTTNKSNLVNAINEVLSTIGTVSGNLASLVTTNKSNLVSAINEVANMPKGVILNVKDYGAVGNGVANDFAAINAAIADANTKGLTTIYFPSGKYYCGNGTFNLNSSNIQFVGGANTELISKGLSSGAFITINSTVSLEQYNYARVPLKDICIVGNYFNDTSGYGVIGVKMGTDTTFIAPHCILENVTIRNFAVGLELSSAYKTTYLNCSFIANNRGINVPSAGVQQAVPCIFVSCWWECNNYAFYSVASGYNSISVFGGAFEYNRSIFTGYTKMVYVGVRFEYDAHASCEPTLTIRSVYNQSPISGSQSVSKFIGCFFLELNNFADNVRHWISDPYTATAFNAPRIYGTGGDPVTFEFALCEFESANSISGYYYIATDKYYGVGNYSKSLGGANMIDPSQVVTGANGFIS